MMHSDREAKYHCRWRWVVLPTIRAQFEKDGIPDLPARRESWNNWTDAHCKAGEISLEEYESWGHPQECEGDAV